VEEGDWLPPVELEEVAASALSALVEELALPVAPRSELGITFTDDINISALNRDWRRKTSPTNVLSFPIREIEPGAPLPPALGDIVLALETIRREAEMDAKPLRHHLVHLIVHGMLHLLGHDHQAEEEAERMEGLERRVLARLAIPDHYA
jgi:probable rRNA maturation factor